MPLIDCHTHTKVSPDSDARLKDMLTAAQNAGLAAYAVTDHIELCRWHPERYYNTPSCHPENQYHDSVRWEMAMAQNVLAQKMDTGTMHVVSGIELGEPNADFRLAERLFLDERADFVIASLHELPGRPDFYYLDYSKEDVNALLDVYFTILLEIAEHPCYDVLGHITYPLRYIEGDAGISVDMAKYRDRIAAVFEAAIRQGKGIELNTSGYRQPYGKPFPDEALLRLYKDLGGTILSLGSDAHSAEDVAGGIAEGAALAKSVGFDRLCYFVKHEPEFVAL